MTTEPEIRMPTYTIDDLPSPASSSASGWPWTEASPPLPAALPNGEPWPRISIVTPSFNQAQYLEETIRSVLLQGYPNLEYFVFDGGSTDGSADILRRYDAFLDGWVSERDKGQSDAINKGFARCTGTIVNWLCSDDILLPGALDCVGRAFVQQSGADVVVGAAKYQFDDHSEPDYISTPSKSDLDFLPAQNKVVQPSCFFRRALLRRAPAVRNDLHYLMDWELWCYLQSQHASWMFSTDVLSVYRVTGVNKAFTGRRKMLDELERVYREYCGETIPLTFWMRGLWRPLNKAGHHSKNAVLRRSMRFGERAVAFLLRAGYPKPRIQGLRTSFIWYDA
jgi:glycosyltransferase involved in cell wall biosynthesis